METEIKKESDLQTQILNYLREKGVFCWKQNSSGVRGRKAPIRGIPDILGVLPDGRFLGVEVKKPGGKPSAEQVEFIQRIIQNQGVALIIYKFSDILQLWRIAKIYEKTESSH